MFLVNFLLFNLSNILVIFTYVYIISVIFDKKKDLKRLSTIIIIVISSLLVTISFYTIDNFLRVGFNFIILVIACKYIYKELIVEIFIVTLIAFIYFFVAELLFSLLLIILNTNYIELKEYWIASILSNIFISLIVILFSKNESLNKIAKKSLVLGHNNIFVHPNEMFFVIIFIIGILANKNVSVFGFNIDYLFNWLLTILILYIVIHLFKERQYSIQLSMKYDQLFNYIKKYEEEINKQNVNIHEFKNQLISIKGMTHKNNKELNKYINSIIKELKSVNYKLLRDMNNIPIGGLKGLIYYKLGNLVEKDIMVITKISSNTKKCNLNKLKTVVYRDIIKIIGVLLDNAIESAQQSIKKQIVLEIYYDKSKLNILLFNSYNGKLKIEDFDNLGYSTKGKGRGYGLSLVKQIIKQHNIIEQSRKVTDDYYIIHLIINMKKNI